MKHKAIAVEQKQVEVRSYAPDKEDPGSYPPDKGARGGICLTKKR